MDNRIARRPIPVNKQEVNQLSQKMFDRLMKWLDEVPDHEQDIPFYKTAAAKRKTAKIDTLKTTSVDGRDQITFVYLGHTRDRTNWGSPRQWISGGRVTAVATTVGGRAKPLSMEVNFDASHSASDLRNNSSKVHREIYSVVLHEVTHIRDILHHEAESGAAEAYYNNAEAYYNKPTEVRAFMQQVVSEIEGPLRIALKDAKRDLEDDPEWAIHMMSLVKSTDGIERLLERSPTWDRLRKGGLSSSNRKKILQAVARHVTDISDEEITKIRQKPSPNLRRIASRVAERILSTARGM